ncbi:MAG: antibiotic biosynthesis monooxygenase [Muribaculaceae bacterium]|nr:antibiotic biosynthesis monooxygenase [Muribaculaceae bacterium]
MIRLNCFIIIEKAENRKPLAEAVTELVELSLHDAGVITYEGFTSMTTDNHMMIIETWQDEESLAAHMQSDHFKRLVPRIEELGTLTLEKFTF